MFSSSQPCVLGSFPKNTAELQTWGSGVAGLWGEPFYPEALSSLPGRGQGHVLWSFSTAVPPKVENEQKKK